MTKDAEVTAALIAARFARAGMTDSAITRWLTAVNPWIEAVPVDALRAGRHDDVQHAASRLVPDETPTRE